MSKLVLSLIWHHLDLASHRLLGREIPAQLLLFMETLGFLGFLAVLIANGIVSADYEGIPRWDGIKALPPLMIYNSVPWLVCRFVLTVSPLLPFSFGEHKSSKS